MGVSVKEQAQRGTYRIPVDVRKALGEIAWKREWSLQQTLVSVLKVGLKHWEEDKGDKIGVSVPK